MVSTELVESLRSAELSVNDAVNVLDKIRRLQDSLLCSNKSQINCCIKLLLKVSGVLSHERNIIEN